MTSPPDPAARHPSATDRAFAPTVAATFLALCLFNTWHHVMWRDEIRTWQVCVASPTWTALRENMQYEGVPIVWYAIVWLLTHVANSPFAMQLTHACVATAVVWFFVRYAPFGRTVKILFPFGYFPFFEYATITRNYALVFLCVLITTHVISRPTPRPVRLSLLLAAMAQVSVWGAAFAALFLTVAAARWVWSKDASSRGRPLGWIAGTIVVLIAIGASYVQTVPGPGQSFVGGWNDAMTVVEKLAATVGTITRAWLPLPRPTRHFWNTHLLDGWHVVQGALGLILLIAAALTLSRRPAALLLLLPGTAGLLAFTYTQFQGATRHHGHLFMILIATAWLGAALPAAASPASSFRSRFERYASPMLIALLGIHAISGVGANVAGVFLPFSASKTAAEYLRENAGDAPIVGHTDLCLSPVCGYLGRAIDFPQMFGPATYNTQDDRARLSVDTDTAFAYAAEKSELAGREVILVLSSGRSLGETDRTMLAETVANKPPRAFDVRFMRKFDDATVADETYTIYRIRPAGERPVGEMPVGETPAGTQP